MLSLIWDLLSGYIMDHLVFFCIKKENAPHRTAIQFQVVKELHITINL